MRVRKERNKFQAFCMENGYTAEKIGELLDISKYTVYCYFSGYRYPSRRTQKKFKEVFGIDPREVFDYEV